MKNKKLILLYCFLLLTFCFIVMTSCSSPTESSKGSLAGTVTLEGESDHSSITIALYDLAYLDTTIVRINNQYPQIGVHINQHTEFDHRLQSSVKSTETSTDGSFELTKIPAGRYNIVALKDGWGFKYLYEIEITKGDNEISQQQILFEERHISGNIQENITVENDHHLIIDDDTVFVPNTSSLTIEPGAVIRINPGVDLTIYGTLTAQGEENNMFWVTSNNGFGEELTQFNSIEYYNQMELTAIATIEDNLVEWGKWSWANIALDKQVGLFNANKMLFYNCGCGLKLSDCDTSSVSNIISSKCLFEAEAGIVIENSDDSEISNSILIGNYNGIHCKLNSNTNIFNNYFHSNTCGIWGLTLLGEIRNNVLVNNSSCDIKLASNSSTGIVNINNNILMTDTSIWQYYQGSFERFNILKINHNNFYSDDFFIKYGSSGYSHGIDIDATNNFYYLANTYDLIIAKMIDTNTTHPILVQLIIEPFLDTKNTLAGIQGDL